MAADHLGVWQPLGIDAVVELFAGVPFRWWSSGGMALELHLGRSWRSHDDTDVGVVRSQLADAYRVLSEWDPHVAAAGRLSPWHGEPLDSERHQNNVWCRPAPDAPWALDVTVGDGDDEGWISRRDPAVRVPWERAVLVTADGIPYLAPARRDWLAAHLPPGHPWA